MPTREIIQKLQLKPHPEGGYYRETYRSGHVIKPEGTNARNVSTAIYYLLEKDDKSLFHRLKSDELWFFHAGETLEIITIVKDQISSIILGDDIENGEVPQAIIPAETWFAAQIRNSAGYSLVSCTVAPGFDFADFELADRDALIQQYPHLKEVIEIFTKKVD